MNIIEERTMIIEKNNRMMRRYRNSFGYEPQYNEMIRAWQKLAIRRCRQRGWYKDAEDLTEIRQQVKRRGANEKLP